MALLNSATMPTSALASNTWTMPASDHVASMLGCSGFDRRRLTAPWWRIVWNDMIGSPPLTSSASSSSSSSPLLSASPKTSSSSLSSSSPWSWRVRSRLRTRMMYSWFAVLSLAWEPTARVIASGYLVRPEPSWSRTMSKESAGNSERIWKKQSYARLAYSSFSPSSRRLRSRRHTSPTLPPPAPSSSAASSSSSSPASAFWNWTRFRSAASFAYSSSSSSPSSSSPSSTISPSSISSKRSSTSFSSDTSSQLSASSSSPPAGAAAPAISWAWRCAASFCRAACSARASSRSETFTRRIAELRRDSPAPSSRCCFPRLAGIGACVR
mmetsp:Transcript_38984/g.120486  ORF Transcript_38984/g.120486 Transcript_38984/m.120486 type:complete len:326 (+) Transcript_38984:916-1893(+)